MLLGPALAFFVAAKIGGGFREYEISLLAAVWIAPPLARSAAGLTGIPIGFLACLTLFALILRCAVRERDESALGALRVAQA